MDKKTKKLYAEHADDYIANHFENWYYSGAIHFVELILKKLKKHKSKTKKRRIKTKK